MTKLEFTRPEMDNIRSKIYLTELQNDILNYKLEGNLTLDGIALKLNISKSTVSYQWKQILKKIFKVI